MFYCADWAIYMNLHFTKMKCKWFLSRDKLLCLTFIHNKKKRKSKLH